MTISTYATCPDEWQLRHQQKAEWHAELQSGRLDRQLEEELQEVDDLAAWLELAESEGLTEGELVEMVLGA